MAEAGPTKGKIKFKIISPLALVVEVEVDEVLLPLVSGPTLVLPRHAPLLSALVGGKIVTTREGQKEVYFVSSGIAEIRRDICALCAWGMAQKDVKSDEIHARLETLKSHVTHSDMEQKIQDDLIQFLENILSSSVKN